MNIDLGNYTATYRLFSQILGKNGQDMLEIISHATKSINFFLFETL